MKHLIPLLLCAVPFLAASCGDRYAYVSPAGLSNEDVRFCGGIVNGVGSKADIEKPGDLPSFHCNCVIGEMGKNEGTIFNSEFEDKGDGEYCGTNCFWSQKDDGFKFYAASVPITDAPAGAYIDVADNTEDVVAAVCEHPVYRQVNELEFRHVLAKIGTVTVTAEPKYTLSDVTVTVVPRVSGRYHLYAGHGKNDAAGWTDVTEGSPVTLTEEDNALYLVPGYYTLQLTYTLERSIYKETFTDVTTKEFLLEKGVASDISLALPEGNETITGLSVTLKPWTEVKNYDEEF